MSDELERYRKCLEEVADLSRYDSDGSPIGDWHPAYAAMHALGERAEDVAALALSRAVAEIQKKYLEEKASGGPFVIKALQYGYKIRRGRKRSLPINQLRGPS